MIEYLAGAHTWVMIPFTLCSLFLWWAFLNKEELLADNKTWYLALLYPIMLPAGALGCLIGITLAQKQVYGEWWWLTHN